MLVKKLWVEDTETLIKVILSFVVLVYARS